MIRHIIPLSLVLAALAFSGCKSSEASTTLPPPTGDGAKPLAAIPAVATGTEETASQSDGPLKATGSVFAIESAQLAPKASGILASVSVREGDHVKKGQVVFRLDSADADLGVRQAQAALDNSKVVLARAQLDYDRTEQLSQKGAVPPAMYDQAKLGLQQAQVGVQAAEVALDMAKKRSADSLGRSPISGVVTAKLKSTGEMVTMMPPTVVVVVEDTSELEIRVRLPESALTRVKLGDPMTVLFRSVEQTRQLAITRVNPSLDAMSRTVEVVARFKESDPTIKPGMLAEVTFPNSVPSGSTPAPTGSTTAPAPARAAATQASAPK